MKKINKKYIFFFVFLLVIFITVLLITLLYLRYKHIKKNDALNFKTSYELLNGTIRESDGATYNSITIAENNPIKNITAVQATKLIKSGTGVIYFGADWCPWCRLSIPALFKAAELNNINTIYYLDISFLKSGFKVENGQLVRNEDDISKGYKDLIAALDKVLSDSTYKIKDDDGNSYDTGEKVVYAPLVITIKNGIITSYHSGAVNLNENQTKYDLLTDEQNEQLLDYYNRMFETIK